MLIGNQAAQAGSLMYILNQQFLFGGVGFGFFLDYNNVEKPD